MPSDIQLEDDLIIPGAIIERFPWFHIASSQDWLNALPARVAEICQIHSIQLTGLAPALSMNLVVFGESDIHGPIVLKLSPPTIDFSREIKFLQIETPDRLFPTLIAAKEDAAWLLMQRIQPGITLDHQCQNGSISDVQATLIGAEVMRSLHSLLPPPRSDEAFPTLSEWLTSLWGYHASGDRRLPREQVELATHLARDMVASQKRAQLLHGDLHHGNILQGSMGWHVIDPKGLVAPPSLEVAPWFYNPIGISNRHDLASIFSTRLDIFSAKLGIGRQDLWNSAFVGSVLSDCWTLEDGNLEDCHFATITAALMSLPDRPA